MVTAIRLGTRKEKKRKEKKRQIYKYTEYWD
jgi:hypothetical protein